MNEIRRKQEALEKKIMSDILRVGWSDIAVFPVGDDHGYFFNYTIGLTEIPHPELLVVGLESSQAHSVLYSAYTAIQLGARFEPNTYSNQVLQDADVGFVVVDDMHDERFMMSMSTRIYGNRATGLQLVWPDDHHRFPWHDDYDKERVDQQPLAGTWEGPV